MKRFFNFIPNLISLLNLLSGCLSIIFALEGYPGYAGIFILIAGLFDFLTVFRRGCSRPILKPARNWIPWLMWSPSAWLRE